MRKAAFIAGLFSALVSVHEAALAASIAVHNTGVDLSGTVLANGVQASFWTLSAKPAGAVETIGSLPFRYDNGAYFPDTATAAWVSPQAGGNAGVAGVYTYDLVIDLTGLDPATASIVGILGTDNDGSISLNANPPVATTGFGSFGAPTPFTINSGFVAGLNTIHVQVNNGGDPTAFFVSFTSAAATPAAPSVAISVPTVSWPMLVAITVLLAGLGSLRFKNAKFRR